MDMKFKWATRTEKLLVVEYWWGEQKGLCCICDGQMKPYHRDHNSDPERATIEHLIPRRDCGPNTAGNVRLAHGRCNNVLGALWVINEQRKIKGLPPLSKEWAMETGARIKPKAIKRRPTYVYDPRDPRPPATGQLFVALDKKLVSLPRGATLLPTYKGNKGNVPRTKKAQMTAIETARWLTSQGIRGA